jgi:hypothetical protein
MHPCAAFGEREHERKGLFPTEGELAVPVTIMGSHAE